jgi:YidC/Oxa1 family membrane protein insertase
VSLGQLWHALLNGLGASLAFFYDLIPNYGVAIILLTAAVKLVTLPLSIKSTRSMQAMQKVQPEMKRLQAKYKGDRQKLNEEMMKLYQEHGVNPLGGCLPLVLQMPVLIALLQVFRGCGKVLRRGQVCPPNQTGLALLPKGSALYKAIIAGHAGFLGMHLGLSPLQAYRTEGILTSIPYFLLIAVMAFTSWVQQKQMTSMQSTPQPAQAQMISRLMVFMFPLFAVAWPMALGLYWTTQNLLTIGQQKLLLGGVGKGGLGGGGKGGWLSKFPFPLGPRTPSASEDGRGQPSGNPASKPGSPAGKHKGSGSRKGNKRR